MLCGSNVQKILLYAFRPLNNFRNISVFMFVEKIQNSEGPNYRKSLNVYTLCRLNDLLRQFVLSVYDSSATYLSDKNIYDIIKSFACCRDQ